MTTQTQADTQTTTAATRASLQIRRRFTSPDKHPYDEITWTRRDAVVGSGDKKVFEQKDVEFPDFWSNNAVNIAASKYFRGKLGTAEREWSAKQMIDRVVKTARLWGEKYGYFDADNAQVFEEELAHLMIYQKAAFNSPVWFNLGAKEHPQCSACFILSVEDTMPSILDWIKTEGMIFKGGSGAGISLSTLRSKNESLGAGGKASGPVSFMRGADAVAGMIKSGGTTRRAAKMVVLGIDHPDVMEFIRCKADEENKVRALMEAGYDMSNLNNEAWNSIQFQNANNSVRLTDDFMRAVEGGEQWQTHYVTTGEVADAYDARQIMREIAQAAWECGDPGLQFDTIINDWHTCPNSGRINASNPCSEYMHIDNSACNLSSINLMKFIDERGVFLVEDYKQAIRIMILAQEIIVSGSSYPTEKITKNSHDFRQLGLGYANLGALLMYYGYAYDSDEGRAWAGALASVLAGEAYRYSADIAQHIGPFAGYEINREPMLRVMNKHRLAAYALNTDILGNEELAQTAQRVWDQAIQNGERYGYRNSQVTVIAPTGTIALMMDCDCTGIEPFFSLVTMKQLVGGGWMKLVCRSAEVALRRMGYGEHEIATIVQYITDNGTIEGAPGLKEKHLMVFDCAARPANGKRSISWQGHVKMVAAVQPFISGAISKTFNMPNEATVEEIFDAYMMAWRLGIKAFAVYRDGSKATQPLSVAHAKDKQKKKDAQMPLDLPASAPRRKMPATRISETHSFSILEHRGYITYSMYEDGTPGEIFIRMAKQGSTLAGLLDAFAISVSLALQYGVPLRVLSRHFIYSRFEPSGFTDNQNVRIATSIVDYIFRYLSLRFLTETELAEFGMTPLEQKQEKQHRESEKSYIEESEPVMPVQVAAEEMIDSTSVPKKDQAGYVSTDTVCQKCGGIMIRSGTCMTCLQCGEASGGCS